MQVTCTRAVLVSQGNLHMLKNEAYSLFIGPRYIIAMCVNCAMVAMAFIAATTLRFMLVRLNRKLEQGIYVEGAINGINGSGKKGFRFRI